MKEKKLKNILTAEVIGVAAETQVSETMKVMRDNDISCVIILEKGKPVGIFTERNVVNYASQIERGVESIEIKRLMSSPVLTAHEEMGVYEAYNLLYTHEIRHLAVVDDQGYATGIVTLSNILAHLDSDYFVEVKRVKDVMTSKVLCMEDSLTVQQCMLIMAEENLSCIIIVEDNQPVGIMTERDAAKLLLDHNDIILLPVGSVMNRSVYTVTGDVPLHVAVTIMKQNKLRRLVVVDRDGKIEGLATQSDVVRGLEGKYLDTLSRIIKQKDDTIQSATRDLSVKTTYLDNILRSSVDTGIIAVDLTFKVTYYNPAAERILGYQASAVVGRNIRDLHSNFGVNLDHFDRVLERVVHGEMHTFTMEMQTGPKTMFLRARASSILDRHNEMIGYFLMVNDITRRTHAENELKKSQEGLEQRVVERTRELAKAMEGTVQAMAMAVEMRDPYTSGHQRRVAELAACIAREMGLAEKTVEGIYMAGLIHDIGKIRVPSGILCNPGRLTEAEFGILKPHPEIGYNILKSIDFPWPLAQIVLQHHERLNGTGYPYALKGEEILLESRVLAVADVVEAMFSHRPYRPSLGLERALEEVANHKDTYYDSDVVDMCIHVLESKKIELSASFASQDPMRIDAGATRH